jgi:RNA polymerase sigma-70 factor (ECF subfamily)
LAVWQEAKDELRRLALALGVGSGRVDDVLQDVYLAATEAGQRAWEDGGQRRWLFRVTINRCRLEHRRRRAWQGVWEKLRRVWTPPESVDASKMAAHDEEVAALRAALADLEPELRIPVVLRYFSELDSSEIGRLLDLPASTVRGQLRIARQRLAVALRRAGVTGNEESAAASRLTRFVLWQVRNLPHELPAPGGTRTAA